MANAVNTLIWAMFMLGAYLTPSVLAVARKVRGPGQVVVVNVLLGWTIIGWIVALVMAFRPAGESPAHAAR